MMDLLKTLIVASEKAANIARLLRENEQLFEKLVEQKSLAEANPRFQEDFKTLADVLIQEMVKHHVSSKFPLIQVQGEESNHFYSKFLNKDVVIEVRECKNDTAALLAELLDEQIASILADEVHKDVSTVNTAVLPSEEFSVDCDNLAIWIDPIDGTNEYVKGGYEAKQENFYAKGLKCVTVLIGVYNDQGQPVMGVVNQPFFQPEIDTGFQCHWGFYHQSPGKSIASANKEITETNVVCVGGTEDSLVVETLQNAGFKLVATRGAGYKLLTVVLGLADAYVLSKPTTFFWDTCGPHAILKALGGEIVEMTSLKLHQQVPITYSSTTNCHVHGIVAYRNPKVLQKLLHLDWKV